jgi:hypothetical protein
VKNQKPKPKALLWRKTKTKTPFGELNVQLAQRQKGEERRKAKGLKQNKEANPLAN